MEMKKRPMNRIPTLSESEGKPARECLFRGIVIEVNRSIQNAMEIAGLLDSRLEPYSQPAKPVDMGDSASLPEIPHGLSELRDISIRVKHLGEYLQDMVNRLEL